ncbi:hypothetical protein [Virgibacillus litoralis]|uniref:DUF3953 domain-containing protein n=1 Tax=Virgibacillus litoralis TaxID=578221 RepID=A0ABS4HIM4_9BACI|nr:hypothetical protein [Virgibacillus litoralis]MBP1950770.1 hypothetical protein [Virgibacillus litoralis]
MNIAMGIIVVLGIGMFIYHFFIEEIPLYTSSLYLAVMFLLFGVDHIKERSNFGYLYIVLSALMSFMGVKELAVFL